MLSKLTMIGFHQYSKGHLWDNLELPEGIDKDSFINECLRQGGEFPLLYSNLDFMKAQIGEFSKKWFHNFDRWKKAYDFEYEALYNVDVTTTTTEDGTDYKKVVGNSGGTSTGSRAAYDSNQFQPVDKSTSNANSTNTDDGEHHIVTEEIKRGNQGVTMSQELVLAEFNVWYWNLYQHMAEIFVSEFCIPIYC